jgi:hypothetical protein
MSNGLDMVVANGVTAAALALGAAARHSNKLKSAMRAISLQHRR